MKMVQSIVPNEVGICFRIMDTCLNSVYFSSNCMYVQFIFYIIVHKAYYKRKSNTYVLNFNGNDQTYLK